MMNSSVGRYRKAFKKYHVNPKSLLWQSKKAAEQRYIQAVSDISLTGKTILDIGCGFGGIIPFLQKKTKNFEYEGVDIIPEFVEEAQRLYPKFKFYNLNYFLNPIQKHYDIIFCIGAIHSNVKNNMNFRKRAIKTMFDHTDEILVFTLAGSYPQKKTARKSNVWFADSCEILKFCSGLSQKYILRSHYNKREFTIVLFK